jgi:hypothetical protein
MKWSLLHYNGISSVTYTNTITESKNNYLTYFWLIRELIGFYQLILIIKIFLLPFAITSWLILLVNILLYITIDKLQQLLDYNCYKHIKWLLVISLNPTQFLSDNEYNLNRRILFKQKLNKRELVVNTKFLLEVDVYLFIEGIYNNRLFKLNLLYWNLKFIKEILMIMQFTWKGQLIQKNSFVLEKDWNYIVLDWKIYN